MSFANIHCMVWKECMMARNYSNRSEGESGNDAGEVTLKSQYVKLQAILLVFVKNLLNVCTYLAKM